MLQDNFDGYWIVIKYRAIILMFTIDKNRVSDVALSFSLWWHNCPHCASVANLVMLASLPLMRWYCHCLRYGLPHCPRLSKLQLNKGKDACKLTAQRKHNKGKDACAMRALMPVHQRQQCQSDKGKNTSAMAQTCQLDGGNNAGAMTATTPIWH